MTEPQVTAGTAGFGYKVQPVGHLYRADMHRDYGQRPACICGRARDEHPEALWTLEQPVRRTA